MSPQGAPPEGTGHPAARGRCCHRRLCRPGGPGGRSVVAGAASSARMLVAAAMAAAAQLFSDNAGSTLEIMMSFISVADSGKSVSTE